MRDFFGVQTATKHDFPSRDDNDKVHIFDVAKLALKLFWHCHYGSKTKYFFFFFFVEHEPANLGSPFTVIVEP